MTDSSMTDNDLTDNVVTPPCPVCTGKTVLKDMRKLPNAEGHMGFFHCVACGTEYPRAIDGAGSVLASLDKGRGPAPREGL